MTRSEWNKFRNATQDALSNGYHAAVYWTDNGTKVLPVSNRDEAHSGSGREILFGYYREMPAMGMVENDIKQSLLKRYRSECYAVRMYNVPTDNLMWVRSQCVRYNWEEDYLDKIFARAV